MAKQARQRAPKGGLRHQGRTYRAGQLLPAKYGRVALDGQTPKDPATGVNGAPPNLGRIPLPHIVSFSGLQSTISHVYRNPDEAVRNSLENARIMRADCAIMECLEARQRATALLGWHLEPEDPDDPRQKELVTDLTKALNELPNFTEYRRNLLEAIWAGRAAVQNQYGFVHRAGKRYTCVTGWRPIHGDKLAFRFDDGSGKHDDADIGIKVTPAWNLGDAVAGDRKIEITEQGPAYFLEPWERSMMVVHKHTIEDGVYEDPISAGRIHGVGIRDRIYWCWVQKQETMSQLMEVIQRTGSGITIYWYPAGNPEAREQMEQVAAEHTGQNLILMPRMSGDPALDAYGIDRIEPSTAGIEAMKGIIHEFFGHQIKRYILGQILSSESAATGLGSGVADLHQDTFLQIVRYDAVKLEETLTRELVEPLKMFNAPKFRDVLVRFKIETQAQDTDAKLQAVRTAWDMGAKIKEQDVMDLVGLSMPTEDDAVLINPAFQQQPGMPGMGPDGQPMPGMEGDPNDPNAELAAGPPGSIEDMFGPLAALIPGGAEGGEQPMAAAA